MQIVFYRYGNICEPDIADVFRQSGLTVLEIDREITDKQLSNRDRLELVEPVLKAAPPLFVFSINFYPVLADLCHIYRIPYVCWTVDAPVPELFSSSIRHETNRIFLFDRTQYQQFVRYNPECIFYLPLASATARFDRVISGITEADRALYQSAISFVGSLYSEKDPLRRISPLPEYARGYLQALSEVCLKVSGANLIETCLPDEIVAAIKASATDFFTLPDAIADCDRHVAAHSYVGYHVASAERIRTLNALACHFPVTLYTRSDTAPLQNVHARGGVQTLTEMPKIFRLSKINLNMTIPPIQTGLPLRIFDILGCGGFLMTNYQEELPEYFAIGVDLEAYSSIEELLDKCDYYLTHEDVRRQIAQNGYEKVCSSHTYVHRLSTMLQHL